MFSSRRAGIEKRTAHVESVSRFRAQDVRRPEQFGVWTWTRGRITLTADADNRTPDFEDWGAMSACMFLQRFPDAPIWIGNNVPGPNSPDPM